MPRFMDYHDDLKLPPEAIEQIAQGTREGVSDQFGVRQVELYHNADGKGLLPFGGAGRRGGPQASRGPGRSLRRSTSSGQPALTRLSS
jgi:hypothetical protein